MANNKIKINTSKLFSFAMVLVFVAVLAALLFAPTDNKETSDVKLAKQYMKSDTDDALNSYNKYHFEYNYDIKVSGGNLDELYFKMYMPSSEKGKYDVEITSIYPKPNKTYKTYAGTVAEYFFKNVEPKKITVSMKGILKTRTYDLAMAKELNTNFAPEKDLSPYLVAEKYIESNDPYIIEIANGITGNSQEEIVDNIYKYVQENLRYRITPNLGAKEALKKQYGKCAEYSAAMIALCRAKNIPARSVAGDYVRDKDTAHVWVEVYYDKYGWVMYDPTFYNSTVVYKNGVRLGKVTKTNSSETKNDYMVLRRNEIDNQTAYYKVSNSKGGSASIFKMFITKKIK